MDRKFFLASEEERRFAVCAAWCYVRLITCTSLLLMFIGSGMEFVQKETAVVPRMSEAQVSDIWGRPQRIVAAGVGVEADASKSNSSIWVYYAPYHLVVYESGIVTHCVKSKGWKLEFYCFISFRPDCSYIWVALL